MKLTKKQFFDAIIKTELTNSFTGKIFKVFRLVYLPNNHRFCNFIIEETNKKRAWKMFKTVQQ